MWDLCGGVDETALFAVRYEWKELEALVVDVILECCWDVGVQSAFGRMASLLHDIPCLWYRYSEVFGSITAYQGISSESGTTVGD